MCVLRHGRHSRRRRRAGEARRRAVRDHGQLVPGRGGVQPGGRDLSEHRGRDLRERQLGIQLHAGVAGRLAGAPVLVHAVGARQRQRIGRRRHAVELPLSGADGRARTAGVLAAREPGAADGRCSAPARLGITGLQVNLPFSKQTGDWYWHWNGGFTWLPRAELLRPNPADDSRVDSGVAVSGGERDLSPAADVQPDARERAAVRRAGRRCDGTIRETTFTLSPGARGGWNLGDQQLDPRRRDADHLGGRKRRDRLLVYLSYELPFKKP